MTRKFSSANKFASIHSARSSGVGASRGRFPLFAVLVLTLWCASTAKVLLPSGALLSQGFPTPTGPPSPARDYPIDPDAAPRPVLHALRVNERITIDGVHSEGAWVRAELASKFVQTSPRPGYPATAETEVKILYDAKNLYVGAILHIGQEGLVTAGLEHDFQPQRGDLFGLTLDPFLDRRNSYVFATNPGGAQRDEQTFDNSQSVIFAWSAVMETASTIRDSLWYVEMRIPLNTISFDPKRDGLPWGLNIIRQGGKNAEISHWAPLPAHDIAHRMVKAGYLVGLEGLEAGWRLRIKPFAVGSTSDGSVISPTARKSQFDAGLDIKYGITPKMNLDLTYRTDFSQVEVDQAQVNLTRFSLFFPERREFFIENQGTFMFGDITGPGLRSGTTTSDFSLFHSRQIGLTQGGKPIPLIGGARLTGRAGPLELGFVKLNTEDTEATPSESFTVARVKVHILKASDMGLLFTERMSTSGHSSGRRSQSIGADANLRLNSRLFISSYLASTSEQGSEGAAGRLLVGWRDNVVNTSVMYRQFDEEFNPRLGFLGRGSIRHYYANFGVHPRPRAYGLAEVNPFVEGSYITNLRGQLETRQVVGGLLLKFMNGAGLDLTYRNRFESIEKSFNIFQNVAVDAGEYHFSEGIVALKSSMTRMLSGNVTLTVGDFFDGTRRALVMGGGWRPGPALFMRVALERNGVTLKHGTFLADLASLRTEYAWSTRLAGSTTFQYDTQADQMSADVRLSYRYSPLSDIFLVYQDRRHAGGGIPQERRLSFKVTKLFQR